MRHRCYRRERGMVMGIGAKKIRKCTVCGKIRYRGNGKCGLRKDGVRCVGGMRIIRYPTDVEIAEADNRRGNW